MFLCCLIDFFFLRTTTKLERARHILNYTRPQIKIITFFVFLWSQEKLSSLLHLIASRYSISFFFSYVHLHRHLCVCVGLVGGWVCVFMWKLMMMQPCNVTLLLLLFYFACVYRKSYYPADAYAQSKLAQILFTRFVDEKLKERGDNVCIYAVHPGVVNTALFDTTGMQAIPWFRAFFFKVSHWMAHGLVWQKACLVLFIHYFLKSRGVKLNLYRSER